MTSIKQPGSDSPDNLPLLTQAVGEATPDDLPTLTEVVDEADIHLPRVLSEEEMQRLLHQLETHLETVFAHKLNLHLEQLQRLAIEQAVSELKAELPELLRDALNAHLDSR